MIDKVTPSKIVIKGVVDRIHRHQSYKLSEDMSPVDCEEDRENKWQKTATSQQSHHSKGLSVIELGNKKRSLSKENGQNRERTDPPNSEPKFRD